MPGGSVADLGPQCLDRRLLLRAVRERVVLEDAHRVPVGDLGNLVTRDEGVVLVTVRGAPDALAESRLTCVLDDLLQERGNVFLAVELPDLEETSTVAVDLVVAVTDSAWGRTSRRPR
jgi:hypothetical protein